MNSFCACVGVLDILISYLINISCALLNPTKILLTTPERKNHIQT